MEVAYAKASPDEIHIRIIATNRGPETAELHLLPTLWFRNTWSWSAGAAKPSIRAIDPPEGAAWAVEAAHHEIGGYWLYGRQRAELLFTDNETNSQGLWGQPNVTPYVKDAFHRRVVEAAADAVNPARDGTKFACWNQFSLAPGEQRAGRTCALGSAASPHPSPAATRSSPRARRRPTSSIAIFFPTADAEDQRIVRQALGRNDLDQAVLPLRRRALARRATFTRRRRRACAGATPRGDT